MSTYDDALEPGVPDIRVLADRQRSISRSLGDILKWRREVDRDRALSEERVVGLIEDMKIVKRLLIGLMVSVVTGSASVTIAILLATRGKS